MKISELQDGQVVESRTGRAGRDHVEWNEWKEHTLYVQHFAKKNQPSRLVCITLKDEVWAEGSQSDFSADPEGGTFVVEDYYLQIKGLEKG